MRLQHTARFEALLIGFEGTAEIRIESSACVAGEGQTVLIPAGTPHALTPSSAFKILLVMLKGEKNDRSRGYGGIPDRDL